MSTLKTLRNHNNKPVISVGMSRWLPAITFYNKVIIMGHVYVIIHFCKIILGLLLTHHLSILSKSWRSGPMKIKLQIKKTVIHQGVRIYWITIYRISIVSSLPFRTTYIYQASWAKHIIVQGINIETKY